MATTRTQSLVPARPVRFSLERVGIIAANTFLEAVRQKLFYFLLVIAIGLLGSSLFLREFNFGSGELKFIADFGMGAVTFFGSILAIVATAQLFFAEIENRTALTILAKPVLRLEFVLGKFTGVALVLLVFCALMGVLMSGVLYVRANALAREAPEALSLVRYVDIPVVLLVQWIKFCVLSSLTILIASFSNTNLFTAATGFFVLIICHLQYLAVNAWQKLSNPVAKAGAWLLSRVFPNFQIYNLGEELAQGKTVDLGQALAVTANGALYTLVFIVLAVFSFRQREI